MIPATVDISIIIPLKDEADNIGPVIDEIESVMKTQHATWEIICIDDASTDGTGAILHKLLQDRKNLQVLFFSEHFGQSSAIDAGFQIARGASVITFDGDGQNDPRDIPQLLSLCSRYDLVCGQRTQREDSWIKKGTSWIANRVRRWACRDGISDTGCSLKVFRSSCLKKICRFDGMHRFLPALFLLEGFTLIEVPVNHRKRERGKSKYSFGNRSFNLLFDLFAILWMQKRRLRYKVRE